jgi:Fe-S oxidoreductase
MDTPSREILWNVNTVENIILLYSLLAVTLLVTGYGVYRRFALWHSGKTDPEFKPNWIVRAWKLLSWALLQKGVVREKTAGFIHLLMYVGFLTLLFTTTMVFIHHDLGIKIYQGDFYLLITILSDLLGFGFLVGCMFAAHRRYLIRDDKLHNRFADSLLLNLFSLLIIQGFLLEGLRIHATNDPWGAYSIIGYGVSQFFWGLSETATRNLHFAIWWFHTLTVYFFIVLIPYSKMFHVISSSANLFLKKWEKPKGKLVSPGDLEAMIEKGEEFTIGLGSIKDYTWKGLLDLDACTSCGRCQAACPAYIAKKPLSPKWLILDTRNHMLALQANGKINAENSGNPLNSIDTGLLKNVFIKSIGLNEFEGSFTYDDGGKFRASNEAVQKSAIELGKSADDLISGTVMDPDVFWSCTTCMACVEACPVGIDHVEQIIGNRRNMALMQGEIPNEAKATLKSLEGRKNPYGAPQDRVKWLDGLNVKILNAGDEVDYLYWVGCVSAYDPRKQKIAKSLVKIMNSAGLSFGILGTAEGCTGDPARRLGEENLFQSLAKSNIEILKSIKFKTLVANCPHCFNTIKNEYPEFGNLGNGRQPDIIHHSQLLRKLLNENKLNLKENADQKSFTFHDPCYLGRYNDEYDAPRESLKKIKGLNILEMKESREKGMCCGAGGGHFWMDLKIGERINAIRTDQAAATGAENIATACPFCMQMMEDGVKITNREGKLLIKDIAEVIAENLTSE